MIRVAGQFQLQAIRASLADFAANRAHLFLQRRAAADETDRELARLRTIEQSQRARAPFAIGQPRAQAARELKAGMQTGAALHQAEFEQGVVGWHDGWSMRLDWDAAWGRAKSNKAAAVARGPA